MKVNVVSHSLPMSKIYKALPPPRESLDEMLAFLYLGPNAPMEKDFERTPMLARRQRLAQIEPYRLC